MHLCRILTLVAIGSCFCSCWVAPPASGAESDEAQNDSSVSVSPVPDSVKVKKLESVKPRNVVFILTDDHRWDAMSFLGHQFAETPNLDRLANEGAYFKNALVTTSLCSPSRASILTGLYTFRHRVIDNNRLVPDGTLFFPQYLQQAGYNTGFVGKWHMGGAHDRPRPGFDYWVSFRGQGHYYSPGENYTLNVNGRREPQTGYITTMLTDYAMDFLDNQSDAAEPFFLYLSHKAVHSNFVPEPKYKGSLADKKFTRPGSEEKFDAAANRPRWVTDQRNSWHGVDFPYHSELDIEEYYKRYCESLSSVDDSVGAVLEKLEDMGIADDTLVIYMGDNGFMFGEHGLIDKRVAYDASIRVPMLMRCPSAIPAGTVVDEMVANIDMAPTIMTAMGVQPPPHMDGEDALPLTTEEDHPWRDKFLYVYYWEKNFPQTPTQFAIRDDRFKYITYYGLWDTDELYDLTTDPDETKNLIHDEAYKSVAKELEKELYDKMDSMGAMAIPMNAPRGSSQNKRLEERGGANAADFPAAMVVDEQINKDSK